MTEAIVLMFAFQVWAGGCLAYYQQRHWKETDPPFARVILSAYWLVFLGMYVGRWVAAQAPVFEDRP